MSKNNTAICSAYMCPLPAVNVRLIGGKYYSFCGDHLHVLTHWSASVIMEMISNSRVSVDMLLNRINFKVAGYTKHELLNTIKGFIADGYVGIIDDTLVTIESKTNCSFRGCKLKKRGDSLFCANHKRMPPLDIINIITSSVEMETKSLTRVCSETNLPIKLVRSVMAQLLKFGYVIKEKRGVTNYYIAS